jgi:hypothetical protein
MKLRYILLASFIVLLSIPNASAHAEFYSLALDQEPIIRIGLATNASSVSITTTDSSLVAVSPDEPQKFLATTRVTVSARSYRPPEFDVYHFEIPNIATQTEADALAKEVREATNEKTLVRLDAKTNAFRVSVGERRETVEESKRIQSRLERKRFSGGNRDRARHSAVFGRCGAVGSIENRRQIRSSQFNKTDGFEPADRRRNQPEFARSYRQRRKPGGEIFFAQIRRLQFDK